MDINTNSFWDNIDSEMWDEIAQLVILSVMTGIDNGILLLPNKARPFVDLESIYDRVIEFARTYRFSWIRGITDATRQRVISSITQWIRSGSPLSALESALTPLFGEARARRIAVTEITRLFARGNQMAWEDTGFINKVKWNTSQDDKVCPICAPLDGTMIGIADIDALPPAHPNCRCWISPVLDEQAFEDKLDEILGL